MGSPTTNFGWTRPTVGGDTDVWGDELNSNLTSQDSLVRRFMNTFISSSAPAEAQGGTMWLDNTTNPYVWKMYDGTDWITLGYLNTSTNTFSPPSTSNYVGDIKISAQSSNHGSWLLCNGASVSTTTYSGLFALIGYSFGGSGANFTLPDLRGAVAGGIGTGTYSGASTRTLGQFVGEETHTLTIPEMPSHNHGFNVTDNNSGGSTVVLYQNNIQAFVSQSLVQNTGGGGSHNNMQPTSFAGNYFIYSGV